MPRFPKDSYWRKTTPIAAFSISGTHGKGDVKKLSALSGGGWVESEIVGRIIVANVFNHGSEQLHVGGDFAIFNIVADEVAEDPAEIFMTGIGEEAARVGEHSN